MAGIDTDILMSDAAKYQYDASKESQTTDGCTASIPGSYESDEQQ